MKKELTIATPCFNEAESLSAYFERMNYTREALAREGWQIHLLFIDDGSQDATAEMLNQYAQKNPGTTVLRHARNLGFGAAVKTGLAASQSEWVAFMDADSNYDQALLLEMASMATEKTDIINVSVLAPGGKASYGASRFFFSKGASFVYRLFFPYLMNGIHTPTCGIRWYRRESALKLLPRHDNFAASAEILLRGVLRGYNVRELAASNFPRKHGKSKMRFLPVSLAHLRLAVLARMGRLGQSPSAEAHLRRAGLSLPI